MNAPRRLSALAAAVAGVLLTSGCTSTRLESSWKAPEVTEIAFSKLLVVAPGPDGATRRNTEDALARHITSAQVATSYSVLPDSALSDHAQVTAAAKAAGAQGLVTMRLVADRTELDYTPGAYPAPYYNFPGYWRPRYGLAPVVYDPGMVTSRRVIAIETNVYRVEDGKLLWSGLTSTDRPGSTDEVVGETVEAVRAQLKKDKLIP